MRWPPDAARCLLLLWVALAVGLDYSGLVDAAGQPAALVNVAGVVVDHGDGRVTYAVVPFTEDSLSGMELLDGSGLPLLTAEFGGLGTAVCIIEDTGCDLGACRMRLCQTGDPDSPFWQYAQQSADGGWQVAPLGASSSTVEDGDVDGWFWSADAPDPDPKSLEVIADRVNVDLELLRANASENLEPASITIGESGDEPPGVARWELVGGTLVLGLVVGLGGLAFVRSRRLARR